MSDYYNTNSETGDTLKKSKTKARAQEERVFDFMRPGVLYIRYQIETSLGLETASATRSLRNLVKAGRIEKTNIQLDGPRGKKVYTWRRPRASPIN